MVACFKKLALVVLIFISLLAGIANSEDIELYNNGGVIRGNVFNENGHPLNNAQVVIYNNLRNAVDSVRTSMGGKFEIWLKSGQYFISASAYNYCRQYYPGTYLFDDAQTIDIYPAQIKGVAFNLISGGMISGEVYTSADAVPTEFLITAIKIDQPHKNWQTTERFVVSYHGDYCLEGLLSGYYKVVIRGCSYQTLYYDDVLTLNEAEIIPVISGEVSSGIDFTLIRPGIGKINGRVINIASFLPIRGAEICAYQWHYLESEPNNAITLTNENGEFELELTGGYYYITAAIESGTNLNDVIRVYYDRCYDQSLAMPVEVEANEVISGIDFNVDLAKNYNLALDGFLVDHDSGEPIQDARLTVINSITGEPVSTGNSDCNGDFIIRNLLSGSYLVKVEGPGLVTSFWPNVFDWQDAEAVIMGNTNQTLCNGGAITQDYGTPGFIIAGTVNGSDGPLKNVRIYAINTFDGRVAYTQSNGVGEYQITSGLYNGDYMIFADLFGYDGEYYPEIIHLDLLQAPLFADVDFYLEPMFVDINTITNLPFSTKLMGNYPNPFNSTTEILFSMDRHDNTQVEIYNIIGQIVDVVPVITEPGLNSITWNARTLSGGNVASGVYFYRIDGSPEIRKMLFLK
jgi:hypothetical protein